MMIEWHWQAFCFSNWMFKWTLKGLGMMDSKGWKNYRYSLTNKKMITIYRQVIVSIANLKGYAKWKRGVHYEYRY